MPPPRYAELCRAARRATTVNSVSLTAPGVELAPEMIPPHRDFRDSLVPYTGKRL